MKLRARADEPKATLALLDRFKPEFVAVEPPGSVEVLGGKLGHGVGVAQWSGHGRRLLVCGLDEGVNRRRRQESSPHPLLSAILDDPAKKRSLHDEYTPQELANYRK
jgi:hypothetical protein